MTLTDPNTPVEPPFQTSEGFYCRSCDKYKTNFFESYKKRHVVCEAGGMENFVFFFGMVVSICFAETRSHVRGRIISAESI